LVAIEIEIGIAIGIEIVCAIAIDHMLLTNLGASAAERAVRGHDSSIPIAIPISILVAPMFHCVLASPAEDPAPRSVGGER